MCQFPRPRQTFTTHIRTCRYMRQDFDSHFVTVKMPWVTRGTQVGNHNPYRSIGANVIHIPIWIKWIRCVSLVGQKQNRVVVVGAESRFVDCPDKVSSCIDRYINGHVDCSLSSHHSRKVQYCRPGQSNYCQAPQLCWRARSRWWRERGAGWLAPYIHHWTS